ncbi:MAG: aromatic ring-hydroxylating dioxygenase subunit alpha [Alphaproteobacteria bacterium]
MAPLDNTTSGDAIAAKLRSQGDFDASLRPLEEASTLPPLAYTSEEFYQLEIERIFMKEWLCVGRADQIPNAGDYYCIDLFDNPLVILRDEKGEIQALSTVCRHRGAEVIQGSGNTKELLCRYHLWSYSLKGELYGAPEMGGVKNFNSKKICLPRLKVEVWQGFVFVSFNKDATPLSPRLKGADEILKNYKLSEMTTVVLAEQQAPWNWKLMLDNFMEFYHVLGLHKGTHDPMPTQLSKADAYNGNYEHSFGEIPAKHGTLWSVTGEHSPVPRIPSLTERENHLGQFFCIYPNLLFFVSPEMMGFYRIFPRSPGTFDLTIHVCIPPTTAALPDLEPRLKSATDCLLVIHGQDYWACESMQRGFSSTLAEQGRFSTYDKPCNQIARYVIERVLDGKGL